MNRQLAARNRGERASKGEATDQFPDEAPTPLIRRFHRYFTTLGDAPFWERRVAIFPLDRWRSAILLLVLFGVLISAAIFWSTEWSPDTESQYRQAASGVYTDHHPPLMAAFWRLFIRAGMPRGIVILQISMFWSAVGLLLWNAPRRSFAAVIALVFPTTVAIIGVIWKDAELAIAWATGFTLLLIGIWKPRHRTILEILAVLLILYGAMIRYNAFVAVPPLLLIAITGRPTLRKILPTVAAYVGLAALTFAALTWINHSVLNASSPRTAQMSLPIFDMAGITVRSGTNSFPFPISDVEKRQLTGCYDPRAWDTLYYHNAPCSWTMDRMKQFERSGGSVSRALASAALSHPMPYLQHRVAYTNQFLCLVQCRVTMFNAYYNHKENIFVKIYMTAIPPLGPWLFDPLYALIGALILGWFSFRRNSSETPLILGALGGAVLNLFSYIPFGVAADQRYAFPTFVLLAFAAAAHLSSAAGLTEQAQSRAPSFGRIGHGTVSNVHSNDDRGG